VVEIPGVYSGDRLFGVTAQKSGTGVFGNGTENMRCCVQAHKYALRSVLEIPLGLVVGGRSASDGLQDRRAGDRSPLAWDIIRAVLRRERVALRMQAPFAAFRQGKPAMYVRDVGPSRHRGKYLII